MQLAIFIINIVLSLAFISLASSEDIYRSQNANGSVYFSNKAKDKTAIVATLPAIIRQKNIDKTAQSTISSCSSHSGFDCSKGPDTDGSVICYDGFKDSLQRYAFSCGKAKLQVIEQSLKSTSSESSTFLLRNLSSVLAENIQIKNKDCKNISGPKDLAAYDSAEFSCSGKIKNPATLEVSCNNC